MKARVLKIWNGVTFQIELGAADEDLAASRKAGGKSHLARSQFSFRFPFRFDVDEVHPDLVFLAFLLSVHPYLGSKTVDFPLPVSNDLGEAISANLGVEIRTSAAYVVESRGPGNRPALAFSGGADSAAAQLLMPSNTLSLFIDRPLFVGKQNLYQKSRTYGAVRNAAERGVEIVTVESDFEYIRQPTGFAVFDYAPDFTFATLAPLLLLAGHYSLDSVGLGLVRESFYGTGGDGFADLREFSNYNAWGAVIQMAGLQFFLPVSGLSEATTLRLLSQRVDVFATSCMRGEEGEVCLACFKCLRKESLRLEMANRGLPSEKLLKMLTSRSVQKEIAKRPVHHGAVLAFQAKRYGRPELSQLDTQLQGFETQLPSLDTWLPDSIEQVPPRYRSDFLKRLESAGISVMSDDDLEVLRTWSAPK